MSNDQTVLKLIEEINKRKSEIEKIKKPSYNTNCSFPFDESRPNDNVALKVVKDINKLVEIVGFLKLKEDSFNKGCELLGVEKGVFKWGGFTVNEWVEDIKLLIDKLNISIKQKKLDTLEARLDKIISPELKAQMELDAIIKELE